MLTHDAQDANYVVGQRIATFDDLAVGAYRVRAELLGQDGRVIGQRSLAFTLNQAVSATIVITRNCSGVTCPGAADPSATECSGWRSVHPACSPESPLECGTPGCVAGVDCLGSAPWAEGVCTTEGSCIFMPVEGACESGEYCNSTIGYLPLPEIRNPKDAAIETIAFDDERVVRTMRNGHVETVRWDDLERVEIVTTDHGPFVDDLFWVLSGTDGGCVAPSEAQGTPALVDRLFALPGFDFAKFIEATTSCQNARFLVWAFSIG